MKYTIVTNHITPPIPTNKFDWEAHFDGDEERGSGFGETEFDAVMSLLESHEEVFKG